MMRPGERRFIPKNQATDFWAQGAVTTLFGRTKSRVEKPKAAKQISLMILATDLFLIGTKIKDSTDVGTPQSLKKLLLSYFSSFDLQLFPAIGQ